MSSYPTRHRSKARIAISLREGGRAGTTVDIGPPLGLETYDRDAIIVDYFLGTAGKFAEPQP